MYEHSPEHLRMATARMEGDNEIKEEDKQKRVIIEKSKVGTK